MSKLVIDKYSSQKILELLDGFNNRKTDAFGEVYLLLRDGFVLYTSLLYKDTTIDSEDVIQDIFAKIWISKLRFESIEKIKAYIYSAIKNSFINHVNHLKYVDDYVADKVKEMDGVYDIDIVESELYAQMEKTLNTLPEDYARIIRLFMQGYKSGEIAKIVDKPEQIVYNIKNRAIKSIKKKLGSTKPLILLMLIN